MSEDLGFLFALLLNGVSIGLMYSLIALGFVLVYKATEQYHAGEYAASADTWREVMKRNGNYDLAYIGIGRALLQQKQFKEACDYFAMARDSRNYSEAFRYYRSEWVEQNIGWIFGIVAVLLVVPMVVGHIRKIKWEVDNA